MHLTLPLLHPPLQARDGGELPGSHGEAGISMQVGWGKSPPRVVHIVGRQGGGAACVFALWCMGTLALTSSIRSPQVAAADEEKGGEEETAGAEGALAYTQIKLVPWPMLLANALLAWSAVFRNTQSGNRGTGGLVPEHARVVLRPAVVFRNKARFLLPSAARVPV